MKKLLLIMMVMVLIATPVFATEKWSVGLAGGYPQSSVMGQVEFDVPVKVELAAGIDYNYGKAVGLGAQLYGTWGFNLTDLTNLDLGLGVTSRLTGGFYIAPAGRVGFSFNIDDTCNIKPFIRGDFGYAFGDAANKFFWEVTGGATYTF